jgi:hypothetical protein
VEEEIMQYSFDVQEAVKYGDRQAIIIWNFRFWIVKNKANNKHQYEGQDGVIRTWTYNKIEALQKLFPFWSPDQVRRFIDKMVKDKVLIKDNFNQSQYDRKTWYAFCDESKFLTSDLLINHLANLPDGKGNNAKSNLQNREMEVADVPNINKDTDIKPDIKPNTPREEFLDKFQKGKDIVNKISPTAKELCKSNAPAWDIIHLADIYISGIRDEDRDPPRYLEKAFPEWCACYTKRKEP